MKKFIILLFMICLGLSLFGQETKVHPVQIHQAGATNNQVMTWDGTKWAPASAAVGSDSQALSLNGTTNVLTLQNGGTVDLTPYLDNTDAQTLSYNDATGQISISNGNNLTIDIGKLFVTDYITTTAGSTVTASAAIAADKLDGVIVTRNGLVQRIGAATADVSISGTTVTFNLRALVAGEVVTIKRPK